MAIPTSVLNSLQILVVEDEAVTRTALSVLLELQGAIVIGVGSIRDAIRTIDSGFQPDVLLSNIRLPDGNGAQALEAVRRQDQVLKRRTVAIALSGEVSNLMCTDPESAGFETYLSKPYDSKVLLNTIAQLLSAK